MLYPLYIAEKVAHAHRQNLLRDAATRRLVQGRHNGATHKIRWRTAWLRTISFLTMARQIQQTTDENCSSVQ